jgi:hypothetical protein
MRKLTAIVILVLLVVPVLALPADAWVRGGFHGGFHHGGCCFGGALALGLGIGLLATAPLWYAPPYAYPAYSYPAYAYPAPTYPAPGADLLVLLPEPAGVLSLRAPVSGWLDDCRAAWSHSVVDRLLDVRSPGIPRSRLTPPPTRGTLMVAAGYLISAPDPGS